MDTGEIVKNIGISHQKLYYLEQKDSSAQKDFYHRRGI